MIERLFHRLGYRLGGVLVPRLGLEPSGIHYCLEHSGTRNEDESGHCDWYYRESWSSELQPCRFVQLLLPRDERAVFDVVGVE